MVDPVTALAVVLVGAGVVGSVVPGIPSGLSALTGVWVYYLFASGDPAFGPIALAGFSLLAVSAAVAEYFAGMLASKAGGASTRTAVIAGVVGLVLLFVVGPVGVLVGVVGTVFAAELYEGRSPEDAARAAGWTVAGMLGSAIGQLVLTLPIFIGFVVFVYL